MSNPGDQILERIPKRTPAWAVGVVTIIVAVATSLVTIYVVSRDEVHGLIDWNTKHHEQMEVFQNTQTNEALKVVMSLVQANSSDIVKLSQSLGATQNQNIILTDRVSALEAKVQTLQNNLNNCERKLSDCEKSKRS